MSEKEKYRKIIKDAWYVNRFNHKEVAHTFLMTNYAKGRDILKEDYNPSFITQGLKWADMNIKGKEKTQKTIFAFRQHGHHYGAYTAPSITYNEGELMADQHKIIELFHKAVIAAKEKELAEYDLIFKMIAQGYTQKEIAEHLGVATRTVRNRIHQVKTMVKHFQEAYGKTL